MKQFYKAPNMLMITGSGRGCGKTWLGCEIVRLAAAGRCIVSLKVSPHFHSLTDGLTILFANELMVFATENHHNEKDTGRYLAAGAQTSYYLQLKAGHEAEAWPIIEPWLKNKLVLCESGGLHTVVKPAVLLYVVARDAPMSKSQAIQKFHHIAVAGNNGRPKVMESWITRWMQSFNEIQEIP